MRYLYFSLSEMNTDVLLSFDLMTRVIKIRVQRKKNMDNSIKLSEGQLYEKWESGLFLPSLDFCTLPFIC